MISLLTQVTDRMIIPYSDPCDELVSEKETPGLKFTDKPLHGCSGFVTKV
jgi:hypothetical protein